jgi:phosphoserine aminotransferase
MTRVHNFSAGPAVLPVEILTEISEALPNFNNCGLGLMELSHRSSTFDEVIVSARNRLRYLMNIPQEYEVLFLQGGASLQFYMTALNLLTAKESADYICTGTWSQKAIKEVNRCATANVIWSPPDVFNQVPKAGTYDTSEDGLFLHYTSNNTIYGTQFQELPDGNGKPLVADLSSDICSAPMDVSKHAIIYAGAQKNLGPSGVTAVILSPWAVERSKSVHNSRKGGLPSMLNYSLMVEKESMFNTPNTFGIFALDRMLAWLERQGGVSSIHIQNKYKAKLIYDTLDSSDFWQPHAHKDSRSIMNITWKLQDSSLETTFVDEAKKAGLEGLKGHRSVGGIRASIYNACPTASVEELVKFMKDFAARNG